MNEQNWQEIAKIFEDAKAKAEAVLKAATCDFGEPVTRRNGVTFLADGCCAGQSYFQRAATCVNALAGVKDPAAFVARMKKLVEHYKTKPPYFETNGFVGTPRVWLEELESLVADAEAVAP